MKKILLLLVLCFPCIMCKLLIYKNKIDSITNYKQFFGYIDDIVVLKPDFTTEEFNKLSKKVSGYILPGGSSSVFDNDTKYWKYANLVLNDNKPIIAICNGFHHILKFLNKDHPFIECNIKTNLIIDNKIHNHKWCTTLPPSKEFEYTTFKYNNTTYIESFYNDKIFATVYHPEKILQCNNKYNDCRQLAKVSYSDLVNFALTLKCSN